MPGHGPTPSETNSNDHDLTAAELDAARAELVRYQVAYPDSYALGALRAVAEDVAAGRIDAHTRAAARRGLALAEVMYEPLDNRPDVA